MLVLSRKKNESIVINGDITLTIVEIRGDKVRLGVVCPMEVPVHRQEIHDAIQACLHPAPPPRPPEERPFVQAIAEQPADQVTRLVFADWLEERGDSLGEYLRNQCLLADTTLHGQRREELQRRQRALWVEHGLSWVSSLPSALWSNPPGGLPV
jgi:carbon storage regulator